MLIILYTLAGEIVQISTYTPLNTGKDFNYDLKTRSKLSHGRGRAVLKLAFKNVLTDSDTMLHST